MSGIWRIDPRSCRRRVVRRGFTLMELIISSAAGAVLLAGLSGSLYIASQSFDRDAVAINQSQSQQILGDMMADLNQAIRFRERTATAVTFSVPDRSGNGLPETIRYAWGGTVGDPLTYEYNGSTAVELAAGVQHFDLNYLTRVMKGSVPLPPEGADKLLLVVSSTSSPTSQEALRESLFESWGYTVARIDDDDSQANYDTALAANDVAFVSEQVADSSLGNKLASATIGVVCEEAELTDELGFSTSRIWLTNTTIDIIDNTHYITNEFSIGPHQLVFTDQPMTAVSGSLAPQLRRLGRWDADIGLAVMESGAVTYDGSTTAGRRVALPWGGSSFDIGQLTSAGRKMLRLAIEWAGGAGDSDRSTRLLFVSGQSRDSDRVVTPTAAEQLRIDLMDAWGYSTTVTSDEDTQTEFDTRLGTADAVFVSGEVSGATLGTKLNTATLGVVTESLANSSNLRIVNGGFYGSLTDIQIESASHYITSGHTLGALTVTSSAQDFKWTFAGIAPDGTTLASTLVGSTYPSLVVVEKGEGLYGGSLAVGRRCQLPWGDNGFDFASLNADGQTLMQRAIEWAIGFDNGVEPPALSGVVYEEFSEAKVASDGTSISISMPLGTVVGDLLIAAVATDADTASSLSPPAGWNQIIVQNHSLDVTLGTWWKIAGNSESSSYHFNWSGDQEAYGWIMRFTGHSSSNPIHASNVATTGSNTTTTPTSPAVTTTVNEAMIVRLGGFDGYEINADNPGLSGHRAISMDASSSSGNSASGGAGYVSQATAGESGTSMFRLTAEESTVAITIAIGPAE